MTRTTQPTPQPAVYLIVVLSLFSAGACAGEPDDRPPPYSRAALEGEDWEADGDGGGEEPGDQTPLRDPEGAQEDPEGDAEERSISQEDDERSRGNEKRNDQSFNQSRKTRRACVEGAQRECVVNLRQANGVVSCWKGTQFCVDGTWSRCLESDDSQPAPGTRKK